MKVLFLTDHFLPRIAGGEFLVHAWAEGLSRRGHHVIVPQLHSVFHPRRIDLELSYDVRYFPYIPYLYSVSRLLQCVGILIKERPDLIHANFLYPTGKIGILLQSMFHVPCVASAHGSDILTFPAMNYGNILDPAVRRKTQKVVQQTAGLTYSCESVRNKYLEFGSGSEKLHYLLNGSAVSGLQRRKDDSIRRQYGIAPEETLFLCVSRNSRIKGLELVLQAVELMQDVTAPYRILLIGPGTEKLQGEVQHRRLREKVIIAGELPYISEDRVPRIPSPLLIKYLFESDVFIAPALSGTFELSTADAMAAGLPVIVSSNVGARDIVVDAKNGYVFENSNVRHLAETMKRCLVEKTTLPKMGEANRELARTFSWDAIITRLEQIYADVLKTWNRSPA